MESNYPQMMREQAAGASAQDKIANLLRGQQMQRAQQMQNVQMPNINAAGGVTRTPTIFDAFSTMAQNHRGRENASDLEKQAEALRGNLEQGRIAELQSKHQGNADQQQFQRDIAQESRDDRANDMRGAMQVWINERGEPIEFAMTSNGPVDSQSNPVDLSGFGPPEKKGLGRYGIGGLGVKARSNAAKAMATLKKIDNIKEVAKEFNQSDADSMNKAGLNTVIKTMTPVAFENYVQNNWKALSPRVKTMWTKMKSLGAEQRHALFGAALTKQEGASAENFIVGAEGLNFGDGQRRLDNLFDDTAATLYGYDETMGTNFLDHPDLANYERYEEPTEQVTQNDDVLSDAPTDKVERLMYLRQKKAELEAQREAEPPAPTSGMTRRERRELRKNKDSEQGTQEPVAGLSKTMQRRRGP